MRNKPLKEREAERQAAAEFIWHPGYKGHSNEWAEYSLGRRGLEVTPPDFF